MSEEKPRQEAAAATPDPPIRTKKPANKAKLEKRRTIKFSSLIFPNETGHF
jgi:hypothetical protein